MGMINGGNGSDDGDKPRKPVGYKSPPVHGQTKPGEVRNPLGHNGRQVNTEDAFEKVRRRKSRVTFDGKTTLVTSDEAYWLKQMNMALAGNTAAGRIIAKELAARRVLGPPPLSAEELAQEAADLVKRQALAASICDALDAMAAEKRRSGDPVRVRYGPDGRPIVETPADDGAPKPEPPDDPAD
jgi:hypothetical protein